jgi:hypothetical protein
MITKKEKGFQLNALKKLQKIASSDSDVESLVDELISNWNEITVRNNSNYGYQVVSPEDIENKDFKTFVENVSKSFSSFLSKEPADALSEELFGYQIPTKKVSNDSVKLDVDELNGIRNLVYKGYDFYNLSSINNPFIVSISNALRVPKSEERKLVDIISKLSEESPKDDLFEKLQQLYFLRTSQSRGFSIILYYNLQDQSIQSLETRAKNGYYSQVSYRLLKLDIETKLGSKASPFLRVLLTNDLEKIKQFLIQRIKKACSKLYLDLNKKFLELEAANQVTEYQFEEVVRELDFSEVKVFFEKLPESKRDLAKSMLLKIALE